MWSVGVGVSGRHRSSALMFVMVCTGDVSVLSVVFRKKLRGKFLGRLGHCSLFSQLYYIFSRERN